MNIQLHRKQIVILGMAMMLAVASFWIPSPQRPTPMGSEQGLSEPVGRSRTTESIDFAREPATARRFSVAEQIPRTMAQPDSTVLPENGLSAPPLPTKELLDPREMANGATTRLGKVMIMPVKNPNQPSKR